MFTVQKFRVGFWKKSLMFAKAAFICSNTFFKIKNNNFWNITNIFTVAFNQFNKNISLKKYWTQNCSVQII